MKRSGVRGKYSPTEIGIVTDVKFVSISQQLIESWSVAEIREPQLYDGSRPTHGGVNDLRLGVSSQDQKCETCGETKQCQGHFGHIKLAEPVYHLGFLKYIEKILKCVCHNCYRVKLCTNDYQRRKFNAAQKIQNPVKRLNELTKVLHNIRECPNTNDETKGNNKSQKIGCGAIIPTKIYLRNYKLYYMEPNETGKEIEFERHHVKKLLEELSRSGSCVVLGFTATKPIDLMIRTLAVPPPQIRPSIEMNPEKKAEDDITNAYTRILRINKQLNDKHDVLEKNIKIDELERTIAAIMIKLDRAKLERSAISVSKKKVVKTFKSISDRLKGKEGRFRQNLMGKRVDFSARSVVSPDSNLSLDELGVPEKVAARLTVPEEVTKWNYDKIMDLIKQGKVPTLLHPPEDRIRDDERPINVSKMDPNDIKLNYGMIAQRCLQNGDYVLFNRQPTLHRMSMMGHRVKILPYNTFRLNLSVCTPYNADFDGDEMNMHVPQTFETLAELKHIAHVPKQIVAPKNNAPVMGIVQDALLGVYLFTMRDTFLTREEIMNLVVWIEGKDTGSVEDLLPGQLPMPAILVPEPLWTGKQVMSLIIPKKITIEIKKGDSPYSNVQDTSMIIKKGELVTGALQKEVVGSGAGGLVHSIWLQIGPDATSEFMTLAQRIINNWLISNSFTVGAADIGPHCQLQEIIEKDRESIHTLYYQILNNYRDLSVINKKNLHQRGKKIMESFEFNINENLNNRLTKAQDEIKKNVSSYLNNIYKIITAKSKGSETNLAQIMFLVGNQNVDGKRCPLGFARRALPHFSKDDNSPEPRGFVFSSFYKGLKPHEFFFHAMGGREGLSDTAVKTSRTGYIQRKLVKSLQDLCIKYDGTVRDSRKNFLQKLYGEDGFLSQYIEKHKFKTAELSAKVFEEKFKWKDDELISRFKYSPEKIMNLNEQFEKLMSARNRARKIFLFQKDQTSIEYYCPINIERLVNKIKAIDDSHARDIVEPHYVYELVEKLLERCIPPQSKRKLMEIRRNIEEKNITTRRINSKITEFERDSGIELFRIHIRHHLASKRLCDGLELTKSAFEGLIQEIESKFYQALAQPGESIGSIAAQSIGEPTTQMTLNTFHLAGVSDKNVTLGVPRLQQLLDSSKNIKTPNMTIFLKDPILYKNRQSEANQTTILQLITYHLPERHIKDYLESSQFYYDPDPRNSRVGFKINEEKQEKNRSPWVMSLSFNYKKLSMKSLWEEIVDKIDKKFRSIFEVLEHVEYDDGDELHNPELTLRYLDVGETTIKGGKETTIFNLMTKYEYEIKNTSVGGIPNIKSVKTSKRFIYNAPDTDRTDANKEKYEITIFETNGSNLRACLSHHMIDSRKTYSNDMTEIYEVLGIEAARQCFINEFKEIIKPYGIYVNHRHLSVLTDWMSMRGFITPVNRNGINRVRDVSVLRKASYEETSEILFAAAVFSEHDQLKGVSEKVIFGQPIEMGTSSFKVLIDTEKVSSYVAKAEVHRNEHNVYSQDDNQLPLGGRSFLDTPNIINTPMPDLGGQSILSRRSPGGFQTPAHTRDMHFTPYNDISLTGRSPMMTPLHNSGNLPSGTPFAFNTPRYNLGNISGFGTPRSGYQQDIIRSSDMRSQHNQQGSPSYSPRSSILSSPNYTNSPINSSVPYSPSYASQASDSSRQHNIKQDQDHEDNSDEQEDDF